MTAIPFDFRSAPIGPSERRAITWLAEASQVATKFWTRTWPFLQRLDVERVERRAPEKTLATLPKTALAVDLNLGGNRSLAGLLILERPLLLAIISGVIGEPVASIPPDRELTHVERSLVDYAIPQLLHPFAATWPGADPLQLAVASFGVPKNVCRIPAAEPVIEIRMSLQIEVAPHTVILMLPQFGPLSSDAEDSPSSHSAHAFERSQCESVIRELPVEFSVQLGETRLSLREFAELKPGDILVLDRRVVEPLIGQVEGKTRFRVSPGAIGNQQAVQVCSFCCVDEAGPVGDA